MEEEVKTSKSKLDQKEQKLGQKETILSQKEKEFKEREKQIEHCMKELEEKEKQLQGMNEGNVEKKSSGGFGLFKKFRKPTSASSSSSMEEGELDDYERELPEETGFENTITCDYRRSQDRKVYNHI